MQRLAGVDPLVDGWVEVQERCLSLRGRSGARWVTRADCDPRILCD